MVGRPSIRPRVPASLDVALLGVASALAAPPCTRLTRSLDRSRAEVPGRGEILGLWPDNPATANPRWRKLLVSLACDHCRLIVPGIRRGLINVVVDEPLSNNDLLDALAAITTGGVGQSPLLM